MTFADLAEITNKFISDYKSSTPMKLKCIDAYLTYCFFTGVIQVFSARRIVFFGISEAANYTSGTPKLRQNFHDI